MFLTHLSIRGIPQVLSTRYATLFFQTQFHLVLLSVLGFPSIETETKEVIFYWEVKFQINKMREYGPEIRKEGKWV